MERRTFIKNVGITALSPFIFEALSGCYEHAERQRILVLVQLTGGNDGLNTLIPLDNYRRITEIRANLYIPENKILPMRDTSINGLHPAMEGIRELYDSRLVQFVQGVGYENPDYSHFRSTDIWLTGSDSRQMLETGWMARYLETGYKNYPQGFPNAQHPDPPAIKIGDTGTFLFQGTAMDMSIVVDPYSGFDTPDVDPETGQADSYAREKIETIREILLQTQRYSGTVKKALSSSYVHVSSYPKNGENPLADQLKMVAKLIQGGLQTSVYLVELKGFDTHNAQVEASDTTKGLHARLLGQLSQAVACFWEDMNRIGREKDVLGMTFSEFGRRIMSNGSYGTDHGSSQPLMLFGEKVKPGIIGKNPIIPERVTSEDNLAMEYDYRSVYASVLKNWLGTPPEMIPAVLGNHYPEMELFR